MDNHYHSKNLISNVEFKNFYFSFGSDKEFPFQNGWIIVKAIDRLQAIRFFRVFFPDRKPDTNVYNCSSCYSEKEWEEMNPEKNWKGYKCYGVLKATFTDFEREVMTV